MTAVPTESRFDLRRIAKVLRPLRPVYKKACVGLHPEAIGSVSIELSNGEVNVRPHFEDSALEEMRVTFMQAPEGSCESCGVPRGTGSPPSSINLEDL